MNACTTSSHARFEGIILPDPRPTSDAADNASKFAETTAKTTCNAAMPLQRFCTHPHNPPTHTTPFVESYYLAALTAPIMGTKPRSLLGGGRFIIMIYIISLTLLLQQPTFLATLREQWATNPRPTPQRRWEPNTEALRTGTAWSHAFETKKTLAERSTRRTVQVHKTLRSGRLQKSPPNPTVSPALLSAWRGHTRVASG